MSYLVFLKRSTEKELDRLPTRIHDRIMERLIRLKTEPRPEDAKKLHWREGYRIRVGDYRVLYVIDDVQNKVEVISVAHRREAYR